MQNGISKTKAIVFSVMVLLVAAGFGYIYFAKRKLSPQTAARSASPIDITPLLVAKLQSLVLQSSDSLYHLTIEQLQPDILASQVQAFHISLIPDSAVLLTLDRAKKAPDDVFTLSFDTLRITGINAIDFLHKKDIRLDTIFLSSPRITIAHASRPYNAAIRKQDSSMTLYQKLTQQFTSLHIGAIIAKDGNVVSTDLSRSNATTRLSNVSIQVSDIAIDSLTQHDTSRFFFSKAADFTCRDYTATSDDSLYTFRLGSVSVSADQHQLVIKDLILEPKGGKAAFQRKLKTRNDMFTLHFPRIVATQVDWWALVNRQSLYAGNIAIDGGLVKDYFDRTPPRSGKPTRKDNYPHQMLARLPFPVLVEKVDVKGLDVVYEEYNPDIHRSGTVSFNAISGNISNITNVASRIKALPQATSSLAGQFMNKVPITASFGFNLARARTGAFTARFHLGAVPGALLNTVAEPLGLYTLKSGNTEETNVSISGDNYTATTGITMLYHNLSIYPLKVTSDGKTKEMKLVGFLANTLGIKNANPSGKEAPRSPEVHVVRDKTGGSFFNFVWQCVLTGIVKSVGLPKKLAEP
ncbi:MAG: hypothetical protein INR73_27845 [Williamsia sp.]|nr:hypothetical protein [Williamsia sp.]